MTRQIVRTRILYWPCVQELWFLAYHRLKNQREANESFSHAQLCIYLLPFITLLHTSDLPIPCRILAVTDTYTTKSDKQWYYYIYRCEYIDVKLIQMLPILGRRCFSGIALTLEHQIISYYQLTKFTSKKRQLTTPIAETSLSLTGKEATPAHEGDYMPRTTFMSSYTKQ